MLDATPPLNTAPLFTPFRVGRLEMANRIVMAPMSRGFSRDGVMPPEYTDYYRRRAEAGVGLIISECAGVDHPSARRLDTYPSFAGDAALAAWKRVIDAVHAAGGTMMPQIWHAGLTKLAGSEPNPQTPPAGPSGLFMMIDGLGAEPVAMAPPLADHEIADIIAAFGRAARDAERLGFDGVEIHGAHGYLIDQFLWPRLNRRTDRFGTQVRAAQFAAEIVAECRRQTSGDFPLFFRWSQWKQQDYAAALAETPTALEALLLPLVDAGVDLFHCSLRRFWEPAFDTGPMTLSGWTRKLTGLPVCTVGSVGLDVALGELDRRGPGVANYQSAPARLDGLMALFDRGEFDLVAVGRALISEPEWADKVRRGDYDRLKPYATTDLSVLV